MRWMVFILLFISAPAAWAQDCVDPSAPVDDCDDDGFSRSENDCDDEDPSINPDAAELCDDSVDNNCNGVVDERCDLRDGQLSGGSGCGAQNGWAALFLPVFLLGRRRR